MLNKPFIFLASPYSNPDAETRHKRFLAAAKAAANLTQLGNLVYCPITHTAPMAEYGHLPQDCNYWLDLNRFYFERCDLLVILKLIGWDISVGIRQEMDWAEELGKPVIFIGPV